MNSENIPKNDGIYDIYYNGKFVCKGILESDWNVIKILTLKNEDIDKDFFYNRLKNAIDYREKVLNYKDTYRLVYAEADYLPSVVIDKYNNLCYMQISSKVMSNYSKIIYECLTELTDITTLYCDIKGHKKTIYGNRDDLQTIIKEGSAKFIVNLKGHKTGFFLDQRENRLDVERYIKEGFKVLDICCYTGGFSVHCGIKGAEVIGVDISKSALKVAEKNMELNNIKNYELINGNAFDIMRDLIEKGEKFDVVILDPPAFAKSSKDVKNALKAYNTLNYLGLKLTKNLFITCSCSHHIDRETFKNTVVSSSIRASKELRQIGPYRTQSPDHIIPMTNRNLEYLKVLFFNVV